MPTLPPVQPIRPAALALIAALCLAQPAFAQQPPAGLQPLPEPPPMPVDNPDEAPQVTITKRGEDTVEEYRVRGKLYMVKVTPPHGVPYYLIDHKGDGSMVRSEVSPGVSVPMWVLKSW